MVVFGVKCKVVKMTGRDIYGQEIRGSVTDEKCAVVKLKQTSQHSTVRVDSGATRAGADELTSSVVLLMRLSTKALVDDRIEMATGERLRVISKRLRYTVLGKLDHYEIGCETD